MCDHWAGPHVTVGVADAIGTPATLAVVGLLAGAVGATVGTRLRALGVTRGAGRR